MLIADMAKEMSEMFQHRLKTEHRIELTGEAVECEDTSEMGPHDWRGPVEDWKRQRFWQGSRRAYLPATTS